MAQSSAANLPTLQNGSSGLAVPLVQRLLVLYGYASTVGAVDGQFGNSTQAAVLQFQRDQNLTNKDGAVGDQTWNAFAYPAGTQRP